MPSTPATTSRAAAEVHGTTLKKERGSDVGDRHLDERELELQSLARLHEVLGAAILGGDLQAWSG